MKNLVKFIGITGLPGSGKTSTASKIISAAKPLGYSVAVISIADHVKRLLKDICDITKNTSSKHGKLGNDAHEQRASRLRGSLEGMYEESITYAEFTTLRNMIANLQTGNEIYPYLMEVVLPQEKTIQLVKDKIKSCNCDIVIVDDIRHIMQFCSFEIEFTKKFIPIFIDEDIETIAKRKGISVEEVENRSKQKQECEISSIIKPYIEMKYGIERIVNSETEITCDFLNLV